jgi:hypothetical protein
MRVMRSQVIVAGLLTYATYITVICPCVKTLSCHQKHFFLSVGGAAALVAFENYV